MSTKRKLRSAGTGKEPTIRAMDGKEQQVSKKKRKGEVVPPRDPALSEIACSECNVIYKKESYSITQWRNEFITCELCVKIKIAAWEIDEKKCRTCSAFLKRESFSKLQWKGLIEKNRFCKPCLRAAAPTKEQKKVEAQGEKLCVICSVLVKRESFSHMQWKGPTEKIRSCKPCVQAEAQLTKKQKKQLASEELMNCQIQNDVNVANTETISSINEKKGKGETEEEQKKVAVKIENDANVANAKTKAKAKAKTNEGKGETKKKKEQNIEIDPAVIKRKLTARAKALPPNQDRVSFQIDWDSTPVSQEDENNMASKVVKKGYFGPLDDAGQAILAPYIQSSSTSMTMAQAISLRSNLLQQKAMFRHVQLQKNKKTLHKDYKAGTSVLELARRIDCPPMNVFRTILAEMKLGKAAIKTSLRDPNKHLKLRERTEFLAAEAWDIVAHVDQGSLKEYSDKFEEIIEHFLGHRGISFVTQNELEVEQKRDFGQSILTPDFLLLDELIINGKRVTWIDAKAFYGANIPFNIKKIKKQMSRYIDHWGSGAIIYLQGFSEKLEMEGCTMLNAHGTLNAEILSQLEEQISATLNK